MHMIIDNEETLEMFIMGSMRANYIRGIRTSKLTRRITTHQRHVNIFCEAFI